MTEGMGIIAYFSDYESHVKGGSKRMPLKKTFWIFRRGRPSPEFGCLLQATNSLKSHMKKPGHSSLIRNPGIQFKPLLRFAAKVIKKIKMIYIRTAWCRRYIFSVAIS